VKSWYERRLTELKGMLISCQEDLHIAQSQRNDTNTHYLVQLQIKSLQETIAAQSVR